MGTTTAGRLLGSVVLCAVALAGCRTPAPPVLAGTPLPILQRVSGDDPALAHPQDLVLLINSQDQLDELGSEQLAGMGVDFSRQSLVILALGEQPTGGYWTRITAIEDAGNWLVVRGLANRPAPEDMLTQALTYPFDAVVIPAVGEMRISAEGVDSLTGQQPPSAEELQMMSRPPGAPVGARPAEDLNGPAVIPPDLMD